MTLSKAAVFIRAAATGLIFYGAIYLVGAILNPISELRTPSGLGTWVLVGGFSCCIEASALLAAGLILLVRPSRFALATGVLLLGVLAKSGYFLSRARFFVVSMENTGYVIVLIAPLVGLFISWLLLLRSKRNDTTQIPNCIQCGYLLKGLSEPRCPECGRVYTLDEFYGL